MVVAKEIGKRIREARMGKTQVQFAQLLEISVNTLRGYESGQRMPPADVIVRVSKAGEVSAQWLLTGETRSEIASGIDWSFKKNVPGSSILPIPPVWEVPLIGFAACSLKGWYDTNALPIRIPVPVDCQYSPDLMAVMVFGQSMVPDGIREGNILYCDPAREPDAHDAVYIKRKDGKASVKRFIGRDTAMLHIQGWLDPDPHGTQRVYFEDIVNSEISTIAPVVLIKRKS